MKPGTVEYHQNFAIRIGAQIKKLEEELGRHLREVARIEKEQGKEPEHICPGGWCWD